MRLLLERGAEPYGHHPYNIQVFYNTHFHGDILWLLKLIHEFSPRSDWDDPEWSMIDLGGYGKGARYFLDIAVDHDNLELAEWILTHGASANPAPPPLRALPAARRDPATQPPKAVRNGLPKMAGLLLPRAIPRPSTETLETVLHRMDLDEFVRSSQHPSTCASPV